MSTLLQLSTALAVSLGLLAAWLSRERLKLPLPPGPTPSFWSGNAGQIPLQIPWQTFAQWAKTYGPIFSYRVHQKQFVVVNNAKVASDLLDSRASIYSDRPMDRYMYLELVNRKLAVFNISSENPRFKEYRKVLNSGLNARATTTYTPILEDATHKLLQSLLSTPSDFISHLRGNAGAVILKIAYGWTVQDPKDDFFIKLIYEGFQKHGELVRPGRWLVDSFPLLRFVPEWFPGAEFKRAAKEHRDRMAQIDEIPHKWVKEQMATGDYIPSFTSYLLSPEDGNKVDADHEDTIKWCSAALYSGGADTTVAVMTAFFLLMMQNPGSQERAQEEIDNVLGTSRLPSISDIDKLPYVSALLKEVLRWAPPAPLSLPHRVIQEDMYAGFRIPKFAVIQANIWAILRDEELYSKPELFNPDRFLSSPPEPDPRKWVFGFGRRICPGAHFAEVSLMLNITSVLALFDILPAIDQEGKEVRLENVEYTTGVTSHIKPFGCRVVPRSRHLETLLALGAGAE